ncbi:MAG TPA: thioredoxin family protein [Smithella sp.]|jgi:small redox-active disulfide protein 2|nr:thioredoxin family protein [Smithella sp.]NMC96660.1 thioredoxin family protein [Deltaproteobacteria bacterium]HNZ32288.1 thioredoxin family protein [Smithellaceae bacterium]HPK23334.1 thioredoxin family protein [Smithella sp.]
MENKITQIRVEGRTTGVVGLEYAIKNIVEWAKGKTAEEISAELWSRVEKRNYIPSSIKQAYGKALLREYKKFVGEKVDEEPLVGLEVVILGPGCAQCSSLETNVRNVMAEMNLAGDLAHVTDTKEIARYGVMGVPALIINGRVVTVGSVPEKNKIRQWLAEAADKMA